MQCDNGGEFLTTSLRDLFSRYGASLRISYPHTSPQNGKAERLIRTTNDILRVLLIHANLRPPFWVEALHTATYILNRRPCSSIASETPYFRLLSKHPTYDHMRVFGCLCFPNTIATSPNKLSPRSSRCVFLGYPLEHKGYLCLDLSTHKVIISHHVTFDETIFPYSPGDTPPQNGPRTSTKNPGLGFPPDLCAPTSYQRRQHPTSGSPPPSIPHLPTAPPTSPGTPPNESHSPGVPARESSHPLALLCRPLPPNPPAC